MDSIAAYDSLPPGVRFHPTDDELVMYWLRKKVLREAFQLQLVAEVDIYQYHPRDLPGKACLNKDLVWYFYCPIRKKYGRGDRVMRTTNSKSEFWKITGRPKDVSYKKRTVGKVQTLVFNQSKPKDSKDTTSWVMYEYSFVPSELEKMGVSDAFVLCKIVKKSKPGPRTGEQYGAPFNEEEWGAPTLPFVSDSLAVNGLVSSNVYPLVTLEQIFSDDMSVSTVVNQAPYPISDPANVASTSTGAAVPVYGAPFSASAAVNGLVSSDVYHPVTLEQVFSDDMSVSTVVDQAPYPTYDPANVASTSTGAAVPVHGAFFNEKEWNVFGYLDDGAAADGMCLDDLRDDFEYLDGIQWADLIPPSSPQS